MHGVIHHSTGATFDFAPPRFSAAKLIIAPGESRDAFNASKVLRRRDIYGKKYLTF